MCRALSKRLDPEELKGINEDYKKEGMRRLWRLRQGYIDRSEGFFTGATRRGPSSPGPTPRRRARSARAVVDPCYSRAHTGLPISISETNNQRALSM
ncbi:hypothetical protein HPP92_010920 [Vanilla planifolia]|uniref:Uncharacterized protein n=1 Tax=Vanilla planifolia TaxID=51239 RepID=A0A835R4N3_VANPL|nr:hypothetical protein HPP92_010920 [Vanilla planifolia]